MLDFWVKKLQFFAKVRNFLEKNQEKPVNVELEELVGQVLRELRENSGKTAQIIENIAKQDVENRVEPLENLENSVEPLENLENGVEFLENRVEPLENLENRVEPLENLENSVKPVENLENRAKFNENLENGVEPLENLENRAKLYENLENGAKLSENLENRAKDANEILEKPAKIAKKFGILSKTAHKIYRICSETWKIRDNRAGAGRFLRRKLQGFWENRGFLGKSAGPLREIRGFRPRVL